jgi:hypothetical protein
MPTALLPLVGETIEVCSDAGGSQNHVKPNAKKPAPMTSAAGPSLDLTLFMPDKYMIGPPPLQHGNILTVD